MKAPSDLEPIAEALADLDEEKLLNLVRERLKANEDPLAIVAACRKGMGIVGERYERMEYFLTHLMTSAELFNSAVRLIEPRIKEKGCATKVLGKVVFGTVRGDVHDIGKNIVETLMRCDGFEVIDLGVDVPPERFVQAVEDEKPDLVALSALLTTSFDSMKETVNAIRKAGLRSKVKILVGGGPVDEKVAKYTGADGYAPDAMAAVRLARESLRGKR